MIKLILAITKQGLIGKKENLPWHIKEELMFFKQKTLGHYLLMGEKTFLSLPKKLLGRKIVVLSNKKKGLGFKTINDFKWVIENFEKSKDVIFISGGKSIYEQFYQYANEIYISEITKKYEGDVFLKLDFRNYKKEEYKKFNEFTVFKYTKENK